MGKSVEVMTTAAVHTRDAAKTPEPCTAVATATAATLGQDLGVRLRLSPVVEARRARREAMAKKLDGLSQQKLIIANMPEFEQLVTAAAARAHQRTESLKPPLKNRASMAW